MEEKIDARKLSREELLAKRKEVISLYRKKTPVMEIVERCGLSWPAVNAAIKLYEEGGASALAPLRRGRRRGTRRVLGEEQERELIEILYWKRPWQAGITLPSGKMLHLWNREAVRQLVHQRCGVELSVRGLSKYLHRWGFPLGRPNQRPVERCTREVQAWLAEHQEELDRLREEKNAEVLWVSKRKLVPDGGEGELPRRLSIISAVDNRRKESWIFVRGNFNQEKQIQFAKALIASTRKHLVLIRDGSEHFTGKSVTGWISENGGKITLLPPPLPKRTEMREKAKKRDREIVEEIRAKRLKARHRR